MKFGRTLQDLAAELERQNEAKKDFIVDAGALSMGVDGNVPSLYVNNGGNSLTQYREGITEAPGSQGAAPFRRR